MTVPQITLLVILFATMAMFLWGRWRHDMVAMGALLACVATGLVPAKSAFAGFGHPAVITVACVLVLSQGLQLTGAMDLVARRLLPSSAGPTVSIFALVALAALLSGFMNNVGALALLMPIAIRMAAKLELPAGKVLMPLAFGSILGGMTTLIGTPPNLIVSSFREETGRSAFAMFDFAPVGAAVALCGALFVGLVGWRWVPTRKQAVAGGFESGTYLSEVRIAEGSRIVGQTLRSVDPLLDEAGAQVVGMVRGGVRLSAPNPARILRADDLLVIEVEPDSLATALSGLGLQLEESHETRSETAAKLAAEEPANGPGAKPQPAAEQIDEGAEAEDSKAASAPAEIVVQELVVSLNAAVVGRSAIDLELRARYGINLLALSRQGRRTIKRLRSIAIQSGDLLLVQGPSEAIAAFAAQFGCLPLAERDIRLPKRNHALTATVVMALAVAAAAFGLAPAAVSFAAGALALVALGIVPLRSVYSAVDWPVIVLLGAMLPVADAMATSGAAREIARFLLDQVAQGRAVVGLVLLLVVTMFLSDLMNNAATAAVMCPIAISTAKQLSVSADAFLMAIAIGASCAFLTPIGHQNNVLILGPGGFRFGDYWRLGLALEAIVVLVSVPVLLWAWPL